MTYVPLTELYRRSDIISLHCPLTDRTLHMIDAEAIGQMKDGVIIINTGRGQLIRTSDLIEGLKEKRSERRGWMSMRKRRITSIRTPPTGSWTTTCWHACSPSTT